MALKRVAQSAGTPQQFSRSLSFIHGTVSLADGPASPRFFLRFTDFYLRHRRNPAAIFREVLRCFDANKALAQAPHQYGFGDGRNDAPLRQQPQSRLCGDIDFLLVHFMKISFGKTR